MTVPFEQAAKSTIRAIQRLGVPRVRPTIVCTLPHSPGSFTQGLAWSNGTLYESCGDHTDSTLNAIDPGDGRVLRTAVISGDFAEGVAILDNRLYQVSWKTGIARVFRMPNLELTGELHYAGDGWGLAASSDSLVMSNGSGVLQFFDAQFRLLRRLRVTLNHLPTRRLNDLEVVGNSIYANVLWRSEILEVSMAGGHVARIIDCSELTELAATRDVEHTLNGIAYNPLNRTFFLTGKCWPSIYEISIEPAGDS